MALESNNNITNSVDKINKLYNNLTYFDLYGSSVLAFIIISIIMFLIYCYSIVMLNASEIKADWVNQRCHPKVIPFAGFINKPDGKSIIDYTGENFSFCIQDILTTITGSAVQPFNYLINFLSTIFNDIQNATNIIRNLFNSIRTKFTSITEEILSRILNTLIPLQRIFIALQDSFSKSQAILTAGLYTSLGTYYALQSLMGAIADLIIKILIALAAIIIGLWIVPFTWPFAISMTAVFISIAIPLSLLILFMTQVLHVQTDGVPSVPSCLDKNTLIQMSDKSFKPIQDIQIGDILKDNNKVTAKIKVNAKGLQMFKLNNIIVSGSHIVKHNDKWIKVKDHPESKFIELYTEPYLYCLNTTLKVIEINRTIFTDWDEIYEENLDKILNVKINDINCIKSTEKIHYYLDNGFLPDTVFTLSNGNIKKISDIKIGDMISNKNVNVSSNLDIDIDIGISSDIVYGIVEIDATNLFVKPDKYLGIESDLDKNTFKCNKLYNCNKLYHLLTYSKKFGNEEMLFSDYNSIIDLNLSN
jgi:hypothetical protein